MIDLTDAVAAIAKKQGITEFEAEKQLIQILIIKAMETGIPQYIEFLPQHERKGDELRTSQEVAEQLKVHINTVYNYIESGKLKAIKMERVAKKARGRGMGL